MTEQQFDVFLCYNTEDRAAVIAIAQQLKQNGLKPWMDILELQPGGIWQYALEQQIETISAAAVFIGKQGLGPWQSEEIYAFLQEFIYRKRPIIPVMLPDAPQQPEIPVFLKNRHWVDFRQTDPTPLSQLIWGITGERPTPQPHGTTLAEELTLNSEPAAGQPIPKDDLTSECNLDYTRLRDLLKAERWREADQETADLMLKAMGKKRWRDVSGKAVSGFPCTDLKTLDRLWVNYSNGKWGFSVQRQIWKECGSPTENNDDWKRFCDRLGWLEEGNWVDYDSLTFDLQKSLPGEFPYCMMLLGIGKDWAWVWLGFSYLSRRLVDCGE